MRIQKEKKKGWELFSLFPRAVIVISREEELSFFKEQTTHLKEMQPYLILLRPADTVWVFCLCFGLFCFGLFFFFLTNWRFVAILCGVSLSVSFFQQHLLTSCLCFTFLQFSWYFWLFHYYICYGDLWSVIFAVTYWRLWWWLAFLINKVFLIKACTWFC